MNVFKDMFISFNTIHERDGRTDTHTDTARRHRPRLCTASRGKNLYSDSSNSSKAPALLVAPQRQGLPALRRPTAASTLPRLPLR